MPNEVEFLKFIIFDKYTLLKKISPFIKIKLEFCKYFLAKYSD